MTENSKERKKAKSKGFADLGVPVGSALTLRKNPAITCKTVDEKNKVEYNGKTYLISGLAKELMKTPISGYHAFKYNGVLLAKLGNPVKDACQPSKVPDNIGVTTNTAQVATQAPVQPSPQVVPLPAGESDEKPVKAAVLQNTAVTSDDPLMRGEPLEEAEE